MKKIFILPLFFILLVLFSSTVNSQSIDTDPTITFSENEINLFPNDDGSINVNIKNNDYVGHLFGISIFPTNLEKVSIISEFNHISINSGQSKNFKISFNSQIDAEIFPRKFSITIISSENENIRTTKDIFVNVIRKTPIFILSSSTNKFTYSPNDNLELNYIISNIGGNVSENYKIEALIKKNSKILKRFQSDILSLPKETEKIFNESYILEDFAESGNYNIEINLIDRKNEIISTKIINFKVKEINKISQEEKKIFNLLEIETVISYKNNGNSNKDINLTSSFPKFLQYFFISEIKPINKKEIGSSVEFIWEIKNVQPNNDGEINYKILIWKIWVPLIIIIFIVILSLKFIFKVIVTKKTIFEDVENKDSEIKVVIEIVNRTLTEIKDIVIKDKIPNIVSLIEKFDTIKPTIKNDSDNIELNWNIDSLRPTESKIVTYRIKPKMEIIGNVKLNPVKVNYKTISKSKKKISSSFVNIKMSSKEMKIVKKHIEK